MTVEYHASVAEELYNDGKWRIVKETASLPDGRKKTIVRGYRPDVVSILAFPTPGRILLLREYRVFDGGWVWMLPTGIVDKESDPLEAAKRELREETGFRAKTITHAFTGMHSETLVSLYHFYVATDLMKDPLPQDSDEMIEVHELPLQEAVNRVLDCSTPRMPSVFGLLRYLREHPKVGY